MVAGKTFPAFTALAQRAITRIWQQAHGIVHAIMCTYLISAYVYDLYHTNDFRGARRLRIYMLYALTVFGDITKRIYVSEFAGTSVIDVQQNLGMHTVTIAASRSASAGKEMGFQRGRGRYWHPTAK